MANPDAPRGASATGDPPRASGASTIFSSDTEAMVRAGGSRDAAFLAVNREVLERLPEIVNAKGTHVAVPMQGSGTFAIEAMLTSFVPRVGKVLLLVNGACAQRAKRICLVAGRRIEVLESAEDLPPDLERVESALEADRTITHVFAVHCETASGLLNPIAEIGALVARHERRFLIDAIDTFGALPLDAARTPFDALAAASDKCIEGVPGLGFVICREAALRETRGNATTVVLDLQDQWRHLARTGQYRCTPPIHVIAAFHGALQEFWAEGGQTGRGARYTDNCRQLIEGMRELGIRTLLPASLQSPTIVAFRVPRDANFMLRSFCEKLEARGYVIHPGKLTVVDSFRISCSGRVDSKHVRGVLAAIAEVLAELGVKRPRPA